jgi:F0F1-type ATP synthase assembly protein I
LLTDYKFEEKFNRKALSIVFLVMISFVLIDVVIGSLVDIYYDFTTSPIGLSLFVVEIGVLSFGTYFILKMTRNKIRTRNVKQTRDRAIENVVWPVFYAMVAIMAFVFLQIILFSEYYTPMLAIAPAISYGFAVFMMGLLAYRFFFWFGRNKALVVLLYGLASVSASIYVVLLAVIFCVEIFIHQPVVTTLESAGSFPVIELGLEEILIITVPGILTATTFLSFWGGTITILHSYIKRIGKTSFWILVTTPIIFFLGTLISLFPEIQGAAPEDDPNSIIIPVYITTFSQVAAIALFATAFVSMARVVPHRDISDYMYITCYGLTLFSIAIIATVSGAGYPPFGLPSVSLVGPFSFLLFIGLYRSAISTAQDSKLRRSIKISAQKELKLLDSIGTAEMERELEKKVKEVAKLNAENLMQESGIEPTLTKEEISTLLAEVKKEVHTEENPKGES